MIRIRDGRISLLFVFVLFLAVVGCSGTRDAYKAATGVDETAKVVAAHYGYILDELNRLKGTGELAGAQLAAAQKAVTIATPVLAELGKSVRAYEAAATAKTEADLQLAINNAVIQVSRLVDVLRGIKTPQPIAFDSFTKGPPHGSGFIDARHASLVGVAV